jgi:uncharacterized repeat protein (TIGR03803 family)
MRANRVVNTTGFLRRVLVVAIVVSGMPVPAHPSQAKETVIYNQQGNAANPESDLIADRNGVLYGTASSDGGGGYGAVFSLTPPAPGQTDWTEKILYEFQGGSDGIYPITGLTPDGHGGFFGTTAEGGGGPCVSFVEPGCGTVFHLMPPADGQTNWSETVLYSFQGGSDGNLSDARLLLDDATGALYGVTYFGGPWNAGTVFAVMPPAQGQTNWTEAVLYSFTGGADGGFPFAYLITEANGALYGTTTAGGPLGCGTVFQLVPPAQGQTNWTETVLYGFGGYTSGDGGSPDAGLVADASGNFYSTTASGGTHYNAGTVFELSPPSGDQSTWTETILYNFTGGKDGGFPTADIIMDGNGAIYSTTSAGGTSNNGTVFKLSPPGTGQTAWTEKVLYSFKGSPDAYYPTSGLTVGKVGTKTVLFGDTLDGGDDDNGAVYEITDSGFVH